MGYSLKEIVKSKNKKASKQKNLGTKHPGNLGYYKKTKPTNNRDRRIKRNPGQRHRKHFLTNL